MALRHNPMLFLAASALALTVRLSFAQTTSVACEDVKNTCTIARKTAEQAARDTNEGCQDACVVNPGPNGLSSCQSACLATKTVVVGAPGVLGTAASNYANCIATTCTNGESCEVQAENTRHDCDEAARDTAATSIRSDPKNAQIYLAGKNSAQASCAATEANTRATVCSIGVDCVKSCGETEHACSEASRDVEKNCRVACAGNASPDSCRASCEAARDTAVATCLSTESSCVAACTDPTAKCPAAFKGALAQLLAPALLATYPAAAMQAETGTIPSTGAASCDLPNNAYFQALLPSGSANFTAFIAYLSADPLTGTLGYGVYSALQRPPINVTSTSSSAIPDAATYNACAVALTNFQNALHTAGVLQTVVPCSTTGP